MGRTVHDLSLPEAIERFNELFTSAVRIRLRADVEVAAYLSGGLDSTTTVAYIRDIEPGILNTFSIGFEDKDFDESKYQEEAVRYLNTNHQCNYLLLKGDCRSVSKGCVAFRDTPDPYRSHPDAYPVKTGKG